MRYGYWLVTAMDDGSEVVSWTDLPWPTKEYRLHMRDLRQCRKMLARFARRSALIHKGGKP